MYKTIEDAKIALANSGLVAWFHYEQLLEVANWMWVNNASPEKAFQVFRDQELAEEAMDRKEANMRSDA